MKFPKKSRRRRLIEILDIEFSIFIRNRDNFICLTCGKVGDFKSMQNGHYIRRGIYQFRWHEKNCHCQCFNCNINHEGEKHIYRRKLIELYGEEFVDYMERESHQPKSRISLGEIEVLISHYRNINEASK